MKLQIDLMVEEDIRTCMKIFNDENLGDEDAYKKLQKAAMRIAIALAAKLQTEDTFNRIANR